MSKNHKYEYLKKYVNPQGRVIEVCHENVFHTIGKNVVQEAEERLGFQLPSQLREFYLEIGYGNLTTPEHPPKNYEFHGDNEILRPSVVADIILLGHDSGYISQDVLDSMEPGDLPFFHISDSCLFLMMKVNSGNPNAVYNEWGDLIEENFDRFIWRLYYESPTFYERVQS